MGALRHAVRNFKCNTCERSFSTLQGVQAHMRTPGNWHSAHKAKGSEKDGNARDFCVCGTCWRWFGSFETRDQHLDELNHEPPEFECNLCERYFQTKRQVKEHMTAEGHWDYQEDDESTHSEDTGDSCECGICDDVFDNDEDCIEHEAFIHKWCWECEVYFQTAEGAWQVSEGLTARPATIPSITVVTNINKAH